MSMLIAVVGESGSGKTSLTDELAESYKWRRLSDLPTKWDRKTEVSSVIDYRGAPSGVEFDAFLARLEAVGGVAVRLERGPKALVIRQPWRTEHSHKSWAAAVLDMLSCVRS